MNIIELKINNQSADIADANISMSYNIFSPYQPDLRGLPVTYSISIPKTNKNLILIKEGSLNTAAISVDFLTVISGELIINSSDENYFKCTITSSDANFIKEFGSRSLKNLKEFWHLEQIFKQSMFYEDKDRYYRPFALDLEFRNYMGIIGYDGEVPIYADNDQIRNKKYKPHLKPNPYSFPLLSYGNFYRLPNKEVYRVDKDGKPIIKTDSRYLEGGSFVFPETIPNELILGSDLPITGYIPPVQIMLLPQKRGDDGLLLAAPQVYMNGHVNFNELENKQILTFSAVAGDAGSWQMLDENELYYFTVVDTYNPLTPSTENVKSGWVRYLGNFNEGGINGRAIFAVVTDELENYNLVDSLAYNDIPPVLNIYAVLEKMFSQYGIVLKTDDYIFNKLRKEHLTFTGDRFIYNYKNHLGLCDISNNYSTLSDNTFRFDCKRDLISTPYTEQLVFNALQIISTIPLNTPKPVYYAPRRIGVSDGFSLPTGYDSFLELFAYDGIVIADRPSQSTLVNENQKVMSFYFTLPINYKTKQVQQLDQLIIDYPTADVDLSADNMRIASSDFGILENTTLTGNKATLTNTTLEYNDDYTGVKDTEYRGILNYGYGYRVQDNGTLTLKVHIGLNAFETTCGFPAYFIITKTPSFDNYNELDAGLTKYGFGDNNTVVYTKRLDENGQITQLIYDELVNFEVKKDEIVNMYLVFQQGIQITKDNFVQPFKPVGAGDVTLSNVLLDLVECYADIVFNGDYFIDVAKNAPDINQLKFFKDILVENRLIPYYDNVAKTITLKQFNDVSKEFLDFNSFSIDKANFENNYNKNIRIGYAKDDKNIFNNPTLNDFVYNTTNNKDSYTYLFSYAKSENTLFKTYEDIVKNKYTLYSQPPIDTSYEWEAYLTTSSYNFNPDVNDAINKFDQQYFLRKGIIPLGSIGGGFSLDTYNKTKNILGVFEGYKQFEICTISDTENYKKIGRDVDWNFGYTTNKVTVMNDCGLQPVRLTTYIDVEYNITFDKIVSMQTVNDLLTHRLDKNTFDAGLYGKAVLFADDILQQKLGWKSPYGTDEIIANPIPEATQSLNSMKPVAQRGQYRFRNGLLTNENIDNYRLSIGNDFYDFPNHYDIDEIQSIAMKDFDFVNTFYRNYGYNFQNETINNNTVIANGILPMTDYHKITNQGIVKVWFDNNWYYLLSIDRYDLETEKATVKLLRKLYGD